LVLQLETEQARLNTLNAEIEALRSETSRLGEEAAQVELLRQREAEQWKQQESELQLQVSGMHDAREIAQIESLAITEKLTQTHRELALAEGRVDQACKEQQLLRDQLERIATDFADRLTSASSEHLAEREQLTAELKALEHRLSHATSEIIQRQEEISQNQAEFALLCEQLELAEAKLSASQEELDKEKDDHEKSRADLCESERWVFDLAALRRKHEAELAKLSNALAAEMKLRKRVEEDFKRSREELALKTLVIAASADRTADNVPTVDRSDDRAPDSNVFGDSVGMANATLSIRSGWTVIEAGEVLPGFNITNDVAAVEPDTVPATHGEASAQLNAHVAQREEELRLVSERLHNEQIRYQEMALRSDWLREVGAILAGQPRLWGLMPAGWRRRKQLAVLKRSGLFDSDAYLAYNPDVRSEGLDPLHHFIQHGIVEGRKLH
jgi:hypothetical protein